MAKSRFDWTGQPCIVIASGPSLAWGNYEDLEIIEQHQIHSIAVNTSWEVAPFCNILYAGDNCWWKNNHKDIDIDAERWTCSKAAAMLYGGIYRDRKVKPGYNSGANAVELAVNVLNANPVLMIGFDCSVKYGIHHHGPHKKTANPSEPRCEQWKKQFKHLVEVCAKTRLINCSRYSEIKNIERMDLKEALKAFA